MAFVATSVRVIAQEREAEETVLTSLAFVPYVIWELEVRDRPDLVIAAEVAAREKQDFKLPAVLPGRWDDGPRKFFF